MRRVIQFLRSNQTNQRRYSGRLIATSFETLIPREGNSAYYKKTRLPVSLEIIEEKLNNGDFKNLAELESFFKRMISNAKEFYPRSSSIFDDAERIRKTLSNYMTKNNPAYNRRGYQAAPTPLPPRNPDEEDDDEDDEDDEDDQEEDEDDDEEEEEEEEPTSRRRSIVVKRGRGRPRKSDVMDSPKPAAPAQSENDQEYLNVPYKSLNFQRAQEKVVEEVLRHQEPEYEGPYFEPFINLPPRALKDYYRIVSDPLSLRKLQKIVKGTQSRHDTPGVSEFKNWAAFEERSQLLWENAYFYNEEGSEIYELARELEVRLPLLVDQFPANMSSENLPRTVKESTSRCSGSCAIKNSTSNRRQLKKSDTQCSSWH